MMVAELGTMSMRLVLGMILGIVLATLVGCDGTPDGGKDSGLGSDAGPITLSVGVGTVDFEALPDSGVVEVVKGPQGGIHLIINARAVEMDQPGNPDDPGDVSNPITRFEAFSSTGAPMHWVDQLGAPLPPYHLGWFPGRDGGLEIGGHILRLHVPETSASIDAYLALIDGKPMRIRVTVEQVNGRIGVGEAEVITRKMQ